MIDELIERVEEGEGADRAIDGDIFVALGPDHATKLLRHFAREAPAYTTSLDAVLALIEEKLPGWHWSVSQQVGGYFRGNLWNHDLKWEVYKLATSPARAMLAAFLRAHEEQHDGR